MTSPDPEVERLQREYEAACVAACDGEQVRENAIHVIPAHLAHAVYQARGRLIEARQRAAQQQSDEEILLAISRSGDTYPRAAPAFCVEYGPKNKQTWAVDGKLCRHILSSLRAAGFEIRRRD